MADTLDRLTPTAPLYQQEAQSASSLEFEHQQLLLSLVDKGLISSEFYNSGELEAFAIDEALQRDPVKHLLIGDESGGAHHIPTIMGLEANHVTVASVFQDPSRPDKTRRDLRRTQKAREGRAYKALNVQIVDESGNTLIKDGGSMFFPDAWSTEDVLRAVLSASQAPVERILDDGVLRHVNEIDGVRVVAATSEKTGKIIAGFPG